MDEVFDFVENERNEPRFNPRMLSAEKTSPGPIGLGTRFRAEMMMKGIGRPVVMTVELTAFERPRRLASSTHMAAMDIQGTLTFDPVPEGTRMRWEWDLKPRGLVKTVSPVIALMGRHQEQAIWSNLKRLLEGR